MILAAVDALVLIVLLKTFNDEEVGFGTAFLVALGTSIGTAVLAVLGAAMLGIPGVLLAAVVAALLLGAMVSYLFGVELKRSCAIAAIFMVVHLAFAMGIQMMLRG